MIKASIVIPNYNGGQLLRKNLPKVFEAAQYYIKKENSKAEIIVVDDCSTDASTSVISNLKSQISNLKFLRNDRNLGFASTVNRGVEETKGEVVVLLNTDVRPEIDFLIPLISHFKDQKLFAVGCMDKSIENGKVILRGRGVGKWEKGFLVHARGGVDKTDTLWVSGGSAAFRKSIWEKLGGFDELYNPFYWEDIDLSYRAIKSGYKIVFEPKSVVVHEHEEGAIKKKYSDFKIKTIAYRNQFIFAWMNVSDTDILLSHIFWLPYHFLKMLILRDWAFYLGFIMALKKFYNILISRKRVQKDFKVKDKEACNFSYG